MPEMTGIRSRVLIPLIVMISVMFNAFAISLYKMQKNEITEDLEYQYESAQSMFKEKTSGDASLMGEIAKNIASDGRLMAAMETRDAKTLLEVARPIYEELREKNEITHFYFHDPERRNLLRLHRPEVSGELIDRFTTKEAMRTGRTAHGVELGPLGTLTLRVVYPWLKGGRKGERVIGYIELGKEMEHILRDMHDVIGVELMVFVKKEFLDRGEWERSMSLLGRQAEWGRFPRHVVTSRTMMQVPDGMAGYLEAASADTVLNISVEGRKYGGRFIRLQDAAEKDIGYITVLSDSTGRAAALTRYIFHMAVLFLVAGGVLLVFIYAITGRIEKPAPAKDLRN